MDRKPGRTREVRQTKVETKSRQKVVKNNKPEINKDSQQIHREERQSSGKVARNEGHAGKAPQKSSRGDRAKKELKEDKTERQTAGNSSYAEQRKKFGENGKSRQKSGSDWYSASLNNRRSR